MYTCDESQLLVTATVVTVPLATFNAVSYSHFIVTMALSCIICEARYWPKIAIFHIPYIRRPRRNIAIPFGTER